MGLWPQPKYPNCGHCSSSVAERTTLTSFPESFHKYLKSKSSWNISSLTIIATLMKLNKYKKIHAVQHIDCEIRLTALCSSARGHWSPPRPRQLLRMLLQEQSQAQHPSCTLLHATPTLDMSKLEGFSRKTLASRGLFSSNSDRKLKLVPLQAVAQVLGVKDHCTGTWNHHKIGIASLDKGALFRTKHTWRIQMT